MTGDPAKKAPYHHGDLRSTLVRVGRTLLETETNPSLRAIARAAQVSHGAPMHHFPSWAHLLAACAADGFRELSGDLQAVDAATPETRLMDMGAAYLAFAQRSPVVFRLMFNRSAVTVRTEEFQRDSSAAYHLLQHAVRATDPGMSDARFDALINTVWALIHGISVLELEQQICRSAEDITDTRDFLRHGLRQLIQP